MTKGRQGTRYNKKMHASRKVGHSDYGELGCPQKEMPRSDVPPTGGFEEVSITADVRGDREFILSLEGEPMFRGRWHVLKSDGSHLAVETTGREISWSGSFREVSGEVVGEWQVEEGPKVSHQYSIIMEAADRLRLKMTEPVPWEIAMVRRP